MGVDLRFPLHDRRVVEFALAMPPAEWMSPTETKVILRRVAGPLLPPEVAGQPVKVDFSALMAEEILALASSLLRSPLLTEQEGWIDATVLRGELAGLRHLYLSGDPSYRRVQWELWHALAIEIWFRACFSSDTRLT
jgi:hypothetical protein